jgi:hypothetical protein
MHVEVSAVNVAGGFDENLGPWLQASGIEAVPEGKPGELGAVEVITLVLSGTGSLAGLLSAAAAFAQARRTTVKVKTKSVEVEIAGPLDEDTLDRLVTSLDESSD